MKPANHADHTNERRSDSCHSRDSRALFTVSWIASWRRRRLKAVRVTRSLKVLRSVGKRCRSTMVAPNFPARAMKTVPNNYRYGGEPFDPQLNLYLLGARYLNVQAGRFWTMDPYQGDLGLPQALHSYAFAYDSPPNYGDPTGLDPDLESTAQATGIQSRILARVGVQTQRARQIFSNVCKAAEAIGKTAAAISGVYVIVGITGDFYVGSSLNIEARVANHSIEAVKDLIETPGTEIRYFAVETEGALDLTLSEGGFLRVAEQAFLDEASSVGGGKALNRIRARALKKFNEFKKVICGK